MNFLTQRFFRRAAVVLAAGAAAVVLVACGSDKPAFCADRTNFEDSVKQLPSLLSEGNLSGLNTQMDSIEAEAGTLVESAKADYPQETEAIQTSVESLRKSYDSLPKNPESQQLASVALQAATAISAVKNFVTATNSDCE